VDDDSVGIGTIDTRGKDEIEGLAASAGKLFALFLIAEIPDEELQKMRPSGGFLWDAK